MKKLLFALLILLVLTGCQNNTKKEFVVGFTDYPPLGFKDEKGNYSGFDIDLALEVFERLDIPVSFQYINWDAKTLELNSGNIDAIWNGFTITPQRLEEVLFTESYLDNSIVVIVKNENTTINSLSDLSGKYIAVESESSGQHALEDDLALLDSINLNRFTSINEALLDLNAGNSDAVVADEIYARYMIQQSNQKFKIVENISLSSEEYAIGLRKDDEEMKTKINNTLKEIKSDGTATDLSLKWFGVDLIK